MTSISLAAQRPAFAFAGKPWAADYRPLLQALPICAAILVGMGLGIGPLALVAALSAFGAAILSPPAGLAILAFMTPLLPPSVIPAPGFNTLLVGAIILGSVYRLPIDRPTLRPGLPLLLLFAFTLYVGAQQLPELLSGYAGTDGRRIGYLFIQLATLTGVAVAAAFVLRGRPAAPFVIAGIIGASIAASLAIAVNVLPPGTVTNLVDQTNPTARVVGPFGDPNYFGLFQATAIAACLGLIVIVKSRWLRGLVAVASLVLAIAFAIALSRAALLALATGFVALAFSRSRRTGFVTIGALVVMALVVYPLYLQFRLIADAGVLSSAQQTIVLERSDASRLAAALAGPQMFLTAPLFGVGFGQYELLSGRYAGYAIESHNWYMNVLAEQGLVGILLWIPMLAAVTLRLVRSTRATRSFGLAVFVTYAVGSVFLQPPLSVQTSAFAVIVVVAALIGDWGRFTGVAAPATPEAPA